MCVRQDVFTKLSKFLVLGLERMAKPTEVDEDPTAPIALVKEKEPSKATSTMIIIIDDTIMQLGDQDANKRCIILKVKEMEILIKSIDPKLLRLQLSPNATQMWSLTKLDVTSIEALFCNTEDVNENGYSAAHKRELLHPLECHLDWKISLKNDFPVRWINQSDMNFEMAEVTLKLSIDDLQTVKSIADKQNKDFAELNKVWADYREKSQPKVLPEEAKRDSSEVIRISEVKRGSEGGVKRTSERSQLLKDEEPKKTKDKDTASQNINAKKIELIIINENGGSYVPLFFGVLDNITYTT